MMINEVKKTTIGGQALIEGVMMKGPLKASMSIRCPDQTIDTQEWDIAPQKWYHKTPFVRGTVNLISNMLMGYRCLMKSAKISGMAETEEKSKLEVWMDSKKSNSFMNLILTIGGVLGVFLSFFLFLILPSFAVDMLGKVVELGYYRYLLEAFIKIVIFVLYLWLVSKMPEIKRVFMYHGAEHKSVACYEAGEELTVENAKKHTRFHPRCGTSFLLFAIIVSIFVFSVITIDNILLKMVLRILLLPVVIGISYELIRLSVRHESVFTRMITGPGLWLQNFTTVEPDDSQLEIALTALKAVIPQNEEDDRW